MAYHDNIIIIKVGKTTHQHFGGVLIFGRKFIVNNENNIYKMFFQIEYLLFTVTKRT